MYINSQCKFIHIYYLFSNTLNLDFNHSFSCSRLRILCSKSSLRGEAAVVSSDEFK